MTNDIYARAGELAADMKGSELARRSFIYAYVANHRSSEISNRLDVLTSRVNLLIRILAIVFTPLLGAITVAIVQMWFGG